jgi:hypothetical protein
MFYAMRWAKLDLTCICFQKKNKLTHCCFKSSPSIWSSWIDRMNFLYFWPNKIHVSPTDVVSSLFPPRCRLSSDWRRYYTTPWHASFLLNQNKLVASASSSSNASTCHIPSQAKTEAMNPHHHSSPPSPDRPTHTLHYYHLNRGHSPHHSIVPLFYLSIARAPRHRSFTRYRHSFSPLSHAHHTSTQWLPR